MAERPENEAPREKKSLVEYFEKVWGQALLAVSAAEEEANRTAQKVAQVYGWGQDEVRRQSRLLTERLSQQRREMERNLEDSVQRALSKVKVPRRESLLEVASRMDRIERRIAALEADGGL
jgi:polyhydroxyalkanoate synthesis regulator phasin